MTKHVAIIGSRDYPRPTDVDNLIASFIVGDSEWAITEIVSGGARGVDRRAADEGRRRGIAVREIEPNSDLVRLHGFRHAALLRNREIVEQVDVVYAFWDGDSTGTSNTIAHALALGKVLYLYTVSGVRFVSGGRTVPTQDPLTSVAPARYGSNAESAKGRRG